MGRKAVPYSEILKEISNFDWDKYYNNFFPLTPNSLHLWRSLNQMCPDDFPIYFPIHGRFFTKNRPLNPGELLILEPEPDNPHDPHAVKITSIFGEHYGYLPRGIGKLEASQARVVMMRDGETEDKYWNDQKILCKSALFMYNLNHEKFVWIEPVFDTPILKLDWREKAETPKIDMDIQLPDFG